MANQPRDEQAGRTNSLGLRGRALDDVLNELDAHGESRNSSREFVRWPHRLEKVFLKVRQPGGPEVVIRVACRNLSRGGIGIIHSAYLHPGSKCAVVLPHLTEGPKVLCGCVVRCQHRRGVLHEIGIRFDTPIHVREYIEPTSARDCLSLETVNPTELTGCLVYLDDSELDRKILHHYLRDTRMRIRATGSPAEAAAFIAEGCDLIIVDNALGADRGVDLVKRWREGGVPTPIILVSAEPSDELPRAVADKNTAFVAKPFNQDKLLRAIGEFLLTTRPAHRVQRESAPDDPIKELTHELGAYADRLAAAIDKKDSAECRAVCLQIRGSAPALGLLELGQAADRAAQLISDGAAVEELRPKLQPIVEGCRGAASAPAPAPAAA